MRAKKKSYSGRVGERCLHINRLWYFACGHTNRIYLRYIFRTCECIRKYMMVARLPAILISQLFHSELVNLCDFVVAHWFAMLFFLRSNVIFIFAIHQRKRIIVIAQHHHHRCYRHFGALCVSKIIYSSQFYICDHARVRPKSEQTTTIRSTSTDRTARTLAYTHTPTQTRIIFKNRSRGHQWKINTFRDFRLVDFFGWFG